jgi:RimJ/RimL family protein N-acetyltransferase
MREVLAMLKGEKVILRAFRREDLVRMWEFRNDVEAQLLVSNWPPEPQSLERMQADYDKEVSKGGSEGNSFAIEADGKYIGGCALRTFDRTAGCCELGIEIIDRDYWGHGYGRDAVRVLLDYAFRLLNVHRVWLSVNGNNERAIRCYRACGFVEEGRLREHMWSNGQYVDKLYMGILRSEWNDGLK